MELTGVVHNGVIVLDSTAPLPEGTRVRVSVEENGQQSESLSDVLMKYAGCMSGLPPDMAAQHDHYLHGTPKR